MRDTFGPYRILRKLGEGGMGTVYVAHDPRLERDVALKVIRSDTAGAGAGERLLREARAGARVNHPNVCQIYEAGEVEGERFIVMELLEGEPLSKRLEQGPLPPPEALNVALQALDALAALHARGVVHRDLKPQNIFLSTHGVKVLDFGLAKPSAGGDRTELQLTQSGVVMGSPRYMAPEQWGGEAATAASDLFSLGAVLFEMLAGKPAFGGETIAEVCCAVLSGSTPTLSGGPQVLAADRIVARALKRKPGERFPSAEAMAQAVREARSVADASTTSAARPAKAVTRLAALPLRILRADPETDFLALGIPEEVSNALAGLESIVVRSTSAAARVAGDPPDFKKLASELEVDAALTGTLLRAGDSLRVAAQLVEIPVGTVLWSKSSTVKHGDLFALLEELSRQIVDGLKIRLSPRERRVLGHDVPASPAAYDKYLRANRLNISLAETSTLREARALYEESLGEDPSFAPAWARLGRVLRIIGKYGLGGDREESMRRAGEAFRKALSLNPDLALAHGYYTNFEVEELGRTREAMERLLGQVRAGAADPSLFVGLTHVLRFAGLLEESLAADERARRLDPTARTGAQYSLFLLRRFDEAIARDTDEPPSIRWMSLLGLGRKGEAAKEMRARLDAGMEGLERQHAAGILAVAEGRIEDARSEFRNFSTSGFRDPEGLYIYGLFAAQAGEADLAAGLFGRAVDGGFFCLPAFELEPELAALRGRPDVAQAFDRAARRHREAREAYARLGGLPGRNAGS